MKKILFLVLLFSSQLYAQSSFEYRIDSIVSNAIAQRAFPGAQIYIQKKGEVLLHKAYGYHTYDSIHQTTLEDVFDLASVTKTMAATLALMKLYEEGKLDVDRPFSEYWPDWQKKKDKKNISFRAVLAHQAGLIPYIVFLNKITKSKGKLKKRWVSKTQNNPYNKEAFENLYIREDIEKIIDRKARKSKLGELKYRYSGLTFLLYPRMVGRLSNTNFEDYLNQNFYRPLELKKIGFNPTSWIDPSHIVPTEYDSLFRKTLTKGWVHDENAAILGGVSGNAGLFSNTNSLVPLLEMLLNKGIYKGKQYLKDTTVEEFTRVQFPENDNRRGLGFDKPLIGNDTLSFEDSYPAPLASKNSYGHSGFTGTFYWVDPDQDLIYIFLSNRVYPSRSQQGIYDLAVRKAILFEALKFNNENAYSSH